MKKHCRALNFSTNKNTVDSLLNKTRVSTNLVYTCVSFTNSDVISLFYLFLFLFLESLSLYISAIQSYPPPPRPLRRPDNKKQFLQSTSSEWL